jgi:hypothetical protein
MRNDTVLGLCYQIVIKRGTRSPQTLMLKGFQGLTELFPLNDSSSARTFILVAFRAATSRLCRLVIGEYLHSLRSVGTHLELSGVSSSWNSPMGSILHDMGSIAPDLRFCCSITVE